MAKKKLTDTELDLTGLKEVQAEAKSVKDTMSPRMTTWPDIENMVFMDWKEKPADPDVKLTISPGPRNKILGLGNLLSATVPAWSVPREKNDPDAEQRSSKIEHAANTMWERSNHIQQKRVERQMIVSAATYDEIHLRVISTQDMLDAAKGSMAQAEKGENYNETKWKAEIKQAERVNARTPYLFKIVSPTVCYPLWSSSGPLIAHYTECEMMAADVRHEFGNRAEKALGTTKDYKSVTVCEWWDKAYRYTWLTTASDDPIYAETHGLSFLPVLAMRVAGSDLFLEPKRQNEPFLYTVFKSGIWQAQNSILTALRTNLQALINAGYFYQKKNAEDVLTTINFDVIGNVIQGAGNLTPLSKNIIDQNSAQMWQILDSLFEDSTIYGTALGEKLSANMTFSETALLAQQGRLPIVPLQSALKESLAGVMEIAFRWMKTESRSYDLLGGLKKAEIPDVIEFNVVVEPDLPQDKLQQSQVAQAITSGATPLVPQRWARENVLNEGQSDDLQREIWGEQMSIAAFQGGIQETLIIAKQAADALTNMIIGQAQQGTQQPEMQAPGSEQAPPPEGMQTPPSMQQAQQMTPGVQPGMPPTQELPPTPGQGSEQGLPPEGV